MSLHEAIMKRIDEVEVNAATEVIAEEVIEQSFGDRNFKAEYSFELRLAVSKEVERLMEWARRHCQFTVTKEVSLFGLTYQKVEWDELTLPPPEWTPDADQVVSS